MAARFWGQPPFIRKPGSSVIQSKEMSSVHLNKMNMGSSIAKPPDENPTLDNESVAALENPKQGDPKLSHAQTPMPGGMK